MLNVAEDEGSFGSETLRLCFHRAAALLAGLLSILRDKPDRQDGQTNTGSVSEFIHVDDFRGLPQILLLRIRQRLHPILLRLFSELSRLCRHTSFASRTETSLSPVATAVFFASWQDPY